VIANLDCTCSGTDGVPPNPDEYLVSASTAQLRLLAQMNIQIVSQANNHSLDFGAEALAAAQAELKRLGIASVGAGCDISSAREAVVIQRNGLDIGFLAYASTHPWVGALPASATNAGVAPLESEMIEQDVKELAERVDCVVVSLHWGKEYLHFPPPSHLDLARDIVDWGARIIVGHHPHAIQGIEEWKDGVICYSLGNFLFPDYEDQRLAFDTASRESLLLTFEVSPGKARIEHIIPVIMTDDCVVQEIRGSSKQDVLDRLDAYSRQLHAERYDRFWAAQVRGHEIRRLRRVLRTEVFDAGWRGGLARLSSLGLKNIKSIRRSLSEIVAGRVD
jgi:poly-gamma-glutamate synthesis protein (capsule biosynthesis protein)